MATIQIKRSTGSAAPATLAVGELAYSKGSDTLYIGDPATVNTPIVVGAAIKNNAGTAELATGITGLEVRTLIGAGTGDGTVTNVTAGIGLSGGGSVTPTIDMDFASLTDMTGGVAGTTELILNDGGVESRKAISEVNLGQFNNDQGWTSNAGTVTSVTGGVGVTSSGGAAPSISLDFSELTDKTTSIAGTTEFILQDGATESRKAASEISLGFFNNDQGWTSNTGTITDQPAVIDSAGTPTLNTGITQGEMHTVLGVDPSGTDNSTDVTLTGTPDYITISGQIITVAQVDAATDISNLTTTNVTEGTGLYFTNTRARTALSGGDGITYTSGTGSIAVDSTVARTDVSETFTQDLTITGNLTVNGTTTTVNTETLTIDDNIIVLNNNEAGAPSQPAGVEIERGTSTNTLVRWNETDNQWEFDDSTGDVAFTKTTLEFFSDKGASAGADDVTISVNRGTDTDSRILWNETSNTWQLDNGSGTANDIVTSATAGGVTSISTNAGLGSLSTASGAVTIDLDLSEITDMGATAMIATDEFIILDGGVQKRIDIQDLDLALMDNATSGFTTNVGTVTAVTGGTGVTSSGGTTPAIGLDFTQLTDMTAGVAGTTEIILNNAGTESRKAISEIELSLFNNDSGWTSNAGTVTGLTAGALIDVSGTTNITVDVDLEELTDMGVVAPLSADELVILDNSEAVGSKQKRITLGNLDLSQFNNDSGWTANTGDITQIQITSTDLSITGTGTTSSGDATFDLEVDIVDGGTYP